MGDRKGRTETGTADGTGKRNRLDVIIAEGADRNYIMGYERCVMAYLDRREEGESRQEWPPPQAGRSGNDR